MTTVEQAVFTSTSSVTGQGYRIVAVSPGISAEEKANIATASPSHDSMCDTSSQAAGLTFYTLRSRRGCVARTCHAGREQTGRGGLRVLTQAFVLSQRDLTAFHGNPFALMRTLEAKGALVSDPGLAGTLDAIDITPQSDCDPPLWSAACDIIGDEVMARLLAKAMSEERSIISGMERAPTVLEALLLAMPSNLRSAFSFSIGLKFTLSRRHRWTVTGPLGGRTHRIIRGQKVTLIVDPSADNPPPGELGPWQEMVADCRTSGRLNDLRELTRMSFDDTSNQALDCIARTQIALNHIGEASTVHLFDAMVVAETSGGNRVQDELDARYLAAARSELIHRLTRAPEDDIRAVWQNLLALAEADDAFQRLCVTLYEHFSDLDPPPAQCDPPEEVGVPFVVLRPEPTTANTES